MNPISRGLVILALVAVGAGAGLAFAGEVRAQVPGAPSGRPASAADAATVTRLNAEVDSLMRLLATEVQRSVEVNIRDGRDPEYVRAEVNRILESRRALIEEARARLIVVRSSGAGPRILASGLVDPVPGRRSPTVVGRVDRDGFPEPVAGSTVQNLQGRVAGVTVVRSPTQPSVGAGAGLPPAVLGQRFVAGLELAPISPALGRYFDVASGVLVTEVTDQTPGADAGLLPGDVLVEVGGVRVANVDEVRAAFAAHRAGATGADAAVPIRAVREGRTIELRVPLD